MHLLEIFADKFAYNQRGILNKLESFKKLFDDFFSGKIHHVKLLILRS